MNSMKRQKDRTLKDELPRSVGAQYVIVDQWINTRGMEPKQKQHPVLDGTSEEARLDAIRAIFHRNLEFMSLGSMNQGKLEVVKQ